MYQVLSIRLRVAIGFHPSCLGALALAMAVAPTPAKAGTAVGSCVIEAEAPTVLSTDVARGESVLSCGTGYRVDVQVQLWGDDPGGVSSGDDLIANQLISGYLVRANYAYGFRTAYRDCNEDIGIDELYSRARFKVYTSTGTATSAWHQSGTFYHSC